MLLQRQVTPPGVVAANATWTSAVPSSQQQQPCRASASPMVSSNGHTIVGNERADAGQGFQQQVYVQLQAIDRKLDSLVYMQPSVTESQLPRHERWSRRSSREPACGLKIPGVPVIQEPENECLRPPMSPPPVEPAPSLPTPVPGAWNEESPHAGKGSNDVVTFQSQLDLKRPSLFQHGTSRIRVASHMIRTPYNHVLHRLDEGLGLGRLRSSRIVRKRHQSKGTIWKIVHGMPFQVLMSVIIMVNALCIGLASDAELTASIQKEKPNKTWARIDVFFCAAFFVELLLRAISERSLFFYGEDWMWNLFDFVLVGISVADTVLNNVAVGMANLSVARIFRFVRFVRLIRLARAVRNFHSLRLFILSIFASGTSLLWCAFIVMVILYFFAVCFLNGITEYFREGEHNGGEVAMIVRLYGNVWIAMVTLFMSISGGVDWQEAMEPLVRVHWVYEPIFVYFIFFMFFGVLNIVVGAFVTATNEISKKDRELLVNAELGAVDAYTKRIKEFFAEADKDMSGMLSWEEFEEHLKNPKVSAYFASLELDVSNAHRLFRLLDVDGSNEVGLDEFLDGCSRLKGQARSIDVNMLVYEIERISQQISHIVQASNDGKLCIANYGSDVAPEYDT